MTRNTNVSPLRADCEAFLKGSEQAEGGRAALSIDMVSYLNTPIVYEYVEKDGSTEKDDFAVHEMVTNKPYNAKGEFHKTLQGHRRAALISSLFGFETFNIPTKLSTAIDKLIPEAIALRHYYGRDDGSLAIRMVNVPGSIGNAKRRVIGFIPAGDMFQLVGDDGKPTTVTRKAMQSFTMIYAAHNNRRMPKSDEELLEFMLAYPVEADGKANVLFGGAKALTSAQFLERLVAAAREEGVLPALEKRDREKEDKGVSLKASTELVLASLDQVLTTDESDAVFSAEIEAVMDMVAERWAAYRVRFPILL